MGRFSIKENIKKNIFEKTTTSDQCLLKKQIQNFMLKGITCGCFLRKKIKMKIFTKSDHK